MSRKREHAPQGVIDCDLGGKRGVWLVKVPRYLSDQWEANEGRDVGRLIIGAQKDRAHVVFKSAPNLNMPVQSSPAASSSKKVPTMNEDHTFTFNDVGGQTLIVVSEDKSSLGADAPIKSGKLVLEGKVVKRAECRPPASDNYLKMKIKQFEKSGQTERKVIITTGPVNNFKPTNMHAEDVVRMKAKKEGNKAVRVDRDVLMQALFHAFEKHQYYRLVDLQKLTGQPPGYVKEILQDIAVYNAAPPHKSMWELKPEYRNYALTK